MPRRPSAGNVSSVYGARTHPIFNTPNFHTGEDIGHLDGTALVAPIDCIVTEYGKFGGYGNRMVLVGWHHGRVEIWLCHLASANVPTGSSAREGDRVATMGATGNATGVHLHWEVRVNGVRVNPAEWLIMLALASSTITPTTRKRKKRDMDYTVVQAPSLGAFIIRSSDGAVRSILGVEVAAQAAAGVEIANVSKEALEMHIKTFGYQDAKPA